MVQGLLYKVVLAMVPYNYSAVIDFFFQNFRKLHVIILRLKTGISDIQPINYSFYFCIINMRLIGNMNIC